MKHLLPRFLLPLVPLLLIAGVGFCAVALQIDPGGDLPSWPAGPGLTVDEGLYVEGGIRLVVGLKAWATGTITWQEIFGQQEHLGQNAPLGYYLADHPPLGRVWLGLWHEGIPWETPSAEDRLTVVIAKGRLGSAAAFGMLLLMVGLVCARWYGIPAGVMAAGSLLLMPRVFGHAHLASLETVMNFSYAAAVLSVAAWWRFPEDTATRPPRFRWTAFAGLVWGLALLTKIQAVLIGPPVVLWALWHWRRKAIVPLWIWGSLGLLIFFVGWPWLWFDPLDHALQFFRSTTNRATLYVWYFGERFADVETPWHYPFVLFLTTIPVGLLVLGFWGFLARDSQNHAFKGDGKLQLILAAAVFPLVLFALPGVAVYDGERLFLVSYPLWAIAVGRGAGAVWRWLEARIPSKLAAAVLTAFFLSQGYGLWTTSPCYLNYYNLLINGLPGAERAGMETNYWGDSLTRDLWDEVARTVPEGGTVHVTPVLHPLQLTFMQSQLPQLREKGISLAACIPERTHEARFLVLFQRKADLPPQIQELTAQAAPHFEIKRQGVPLGAFYRFDETSE